MADTDPSSNANSNAPSAEVKREAGEALQHAGVVADNFMNVRDLPPQNVSVNEANQMISEDREALADLAQDQSRLNALRTQGGVNAQRLTDREDSLARSSQTIARTQEAYIESVADHAKADEIEGEAQKGRPADDSRYSTKVGPNRANLEQLAGDEDKIVRSELPSHAENGVLSIDGKWATSVAYVYRQVEGNDHYNLHYKFGSRTVHKENDLPEADLERAVGADNAERIKADAHAMRSDGHPTIKGVLKADELAYAVGTGTEAHANNLREAAQHLAQKQESEREAFGEESRDRAAAIRQRERLDRSASEEGRVVNEILDASESRRMERAGREGEKSPVGSDSKDISAKAIGSAQENASLDEVFAKIQEGLNKRYIQTGQDFHFRDSGNHLAFSSGRSSITTEHDKPIVARDMVALAVTNGWTAIEVKGSEEFRREAWMEASLYGLDVSGYKAREVDRLALAQLRAERDAQGQNLTQNAIIDKSSRVQDVDRSNVVPFEQRGERQISSATLGASEQTALGEMERLMRSRGDSDKAVEMAQETARSKLAERNHTIVGRIVDYGPANYQFDAKENPSFYVNLETRSGSKTIWGVDLERALEQSGAQTGSQVALEYIGRVPVKVHDKHGKEVESHRNEWSVTSLEQATPSLKTALLQKDQRRESTMSLPASPARQQATQNSRSQTETVVVTETSMEVER